MALSKIINLFALSSLAVLLCSFGPAPASAVSLESRLVTRHTARDHYALARRRKRDSNNGRCRPRPTDNGGNNNTDNSNNNNNNNNGGNNGGDNGGNNNNNNGGNNGGNNNNNNNNNNNGGNNGGNNGNGVHFSGGGGKVGVAWALGDDPSLQNFKTDHVGQIYTWSPYKPALADQLGLEFMPMLWGGTGDKISEFQNIVKPGYAKVILGFNEVNEPGQSNMDVGWAVSVWKSVLEPYADQGYQLYAPSTSSNPNGLDWTKQFFQQCDGCRISAIPVHYYDVSADGFIQYITNFHNTFNLPIIVTEFACQSFTDAPQCSPDQVHDFYTRSIQFMESQDWVIGYFAFGIMHDMVGVNDLDRMMDGNGMPNALGNSYINVQW